jgi:sarcosine oxidase delta subunit
MVITPSIERRWHCHRCGRPFNHARQLVTHLINVHNEGPER